MQDFQNLPSVTVERESGITPEAAWGVLSDLSALPEWAPGIDGATMTSESLSGVGAVRRVETAQFGPIEHHVTGWEDNAELTYTTADSGPFSRTLTTYKIAPNGGGQAKVSVTLAFDVKPGAIEPEQAKAVLTKGLTATLQALEMRARASADG